MPTNFSIPKEFTADGVSVTLGASSPNPAILNALATDAPFPAGDIAAGSLSVSA
ncbi:MAG TPA: hypothetical protein VKT81_06630 [Bryobacteraceae bacterium]|nr:hypothetical protein [Bryobacteraceae bacterium]